ncbi:YhhA family cyclophane-containing RiPP [Sphaerotilus sp.]|uniref:YhhA family cyclophane-containing RiPP n=1 Tax=Sphaerotilus sp. TaxID=2093942 RepID=UPI00286D9B24|nr:YhhA family cyclophane-containing RiPP [Sphaerotilus sp.]
MSYDDLNWPVSSEPEQSSIEVDMSRLSSAALSRLIDEVKNDEMSGTHAYDRTHNRHNR